MRVRAATLEDAEEACSVIRRSITELCRADHQQDEPTLTRWLANKTPENVRKWISEHHVFVATEREAVLGVAAIDGAGKLLLNYVSPDARFRGASKALLKQLEVRASEMGIHLVTLESTATARQFYLSAGYEVNGPPIAKFRALVGHPLKKRLDRACHDTDERVAGPPAAQRSAPPE